MYFENTMNTGFIHIISLVVILAVLGSNNLYGQTNAWDAIDGVVIEKVEFHEQSLSNVVVSLNNTLATSLSNGPAVKIKLNCSKPVFIKCSTNPVIVAVMDRMIDTYLREQPSGGWDQRQMESRQVTFSASYIPLKMCLKIISSVQGLVCRSDDNQIFLGMYDAGKIFECRVFPVPEGFLTRISFAGSNVPSLSSEMMHEIDIGEYFANSYMSPPPVRFVPGMNLVVRMDTKQGNVEFSKLLERLFSTETK